MLTAVSGPKAYFLYISLLFCAATCPVQAEVPQIAIIIDDIGYRVVQDARALNLPGPLGFAVLPHTQGVKQAVQRARKNQHEILLHLPMESTSNRRQAPGTLGMHMDWLTFIRAIQKNLAAVPGIIAVNNHEGSELTASSEHMDWLMEEMARHPGLAFVDSRTTHHTVALDTARRYGVPATRRDVFLDYEPGKIRQQFDNLVTLARKQGHALGIAHPHDETIAFLQRTLPGLRGKGIKLVPVSYLIHQRQRNRAVSRSTVH